MQPELATRGAAPASATARSAEPAAGGAMARQLRGLDYAAGQQMLAPRPAAPARPMAMADIQTRLAALGYDPGPIDGKIGVKTRAAIKAFQEAKGLEVDGIVGSQTAAALQAESLAPRGPASEAPVTTPTTAPAAPVTTPVTTAPEAPVTAPVTTPEAPVTTPVTTAPEAPVTAPVTTPEAPVTAPVTTPEAPVTTAPEAVVTPTPEPKPDEPAWKSNPSILLPVKDIIKLSYDDCLVYMDTRPSAHVESLGKDNQFIGYAIGFDVEKTAQLAVRIILRTPDSVVERGASRAEAIRILTSQLRDKGIIRRLLAAEARVIIVPSNKLMTDLPEFAAQRGTYTFDGRPWDTVRGLGSQNTAIAEENLLGSDVDGSIGRAGWANQAAMDSALASGNTKPNEAGKAGPTDSDAVMNNPGVYCEGYSTTNHEFFHTIHMFGLSRQDNQLIEREYNAKKSQPNSVHWADGPRLMPDGVTPSENYASATVYEYFAQTGCAFQGTNTGTDPYTSNPRNNGRSWVTTNEPGLAGLLSRICSDSELRNVNPRAARKAQEDAKAASAPAPAPAAPIGGASAATPKTTPPPAPTEAMGFIQEK